MFKTMDKNILNKVLSPAKLSQTNRKVLAMFRQQLKKTYKKKYSFKRSLQIEKVRYNSTSQKKLNLTQKSISKQKLDSYNDNVRNRNKQFFKRQNSQQLFRHRLPWGTNEIKMRNYVLETLEKMKKLKERKQTQKSIIRQTSHKLYTSKSQINMESTPLKSNKLSTVKQTKYQESRTAKKLSKSFKQKTKIDKNIKKIILTSISSDIPQLLQENSYFTLHYKIKNKTIIFELIFKSKVIDLEIILQKNNLECQSIHQRFQKFEQKSKLELMTIVRNVQQTELRFPTLLISFNEQTKVYFKKNVMIPYCWLHFIDLKKQIKSKSSIIKKSLIQKCSFTNQTVKHFITLFKNCQHKKQKGNIYEASWSFNGNKYQVKLIVTGQHYTLECQGGNGDNQTVLQFLRQLINLS